MTKFYIDGNLWSMLMIDYKTQLKNTMSRIVNEYDKKILMKYIRWMQDRDYSEKTIAEKIRVNSIMLNFFEMPVEDITIDDMEDYIYSDDFCTHYRTGKPMAKSSIDIYKAEIRYFMTWVGADYGKDRKKMKSNCFPETVEWFEFSHDKSNQKLPGDLLTKEEILGMLKKADNIRDQTLISMFYDSMGRLGEVLGLNEDDILPDKYGFYIIIKDDTSKTYGRRVRLYISVPYLRQHLNSIEKGKPLFMSREGNRLSETQIRRILRKWAKKAGIEKRIYPHLFRHSSATKAAEKLTEQQLKKVGGWTPNSRMTGVYIHLSGADTDKAQLEMYGLVPEDEEEEKDPLAPVKCPRCHNLNPASQSAFCIVCGFSLSDEVPVDPEFDIVKDELNSIKKMLDNYGLSMKDIRIAGAKKYLVDKRNEDFYQKYGYHPNDRELTFGEEEKIKDEIYEKHVEPQLETHEYRKIAKEIHTSFNS